MEIYSKILSGALKWQQTLDRPHICSHHKKKRMKMKTPREGRVICQSIFLQPFKSVLNYRFPRSTSFTTSLECLKTMSHIPHIKNFNEKFLRINAPHSALHFRFPSNNLCTLIFTRNILRKYCFRFSWKSRVCLRMKYQ